MVATFGPPVGQRAQETELRLNGSRLPGKATPVRTQARNSTELGIGCRWEQLRHEYFRHLNRHDEATEAHNRAVFYWDRLQCAIAVEETSSEEVAA